MEERERWWADFDSLGAEQVRQNIGSHVYGEARKTLAREWLAFHESRRVSEESALSLAEARAANDLARSANSLAERSADSAREANNLAREANSTAEISAISAARSVARASTSNNIATAAMITAIVAALAAIGSLYIGWKHTYDDAQKTPTQTSTTH
jgi:ferric-dicitrate binding protein FerR (iron transport regulator)